MFAESNKKKIVFNTIIGIAVLVWSFYFIDRGFYMDESGLLALYRTTFLGKKLFVENWDTLQMGGILVYPLFALYYGVLAPIIAPLGCGVVLFMRISYQIIRLMIAIYLYACIKRTKYRDSAFLTALVYYAFIISFKNFSYKSLCDFGLILFICWAYRFFETENKIYIVLMGVATCIAILAYPTMILMPILFVVVLAIMTYKGYDLLKPIIVYIFTCFVCGALTLIYLQFTSGLVDAFSSMTYLSDSSHTGNPSMRLVKMLISYFAFACIAYLPIIIMHVVNKVSYVSESFFNTILSLYWIIFMVAIFAIKPESISLSRLIYGFLIIFMWFPYLVYKRESNEYTRIGQYGQPGYDGKQKLGIIFFVSVCAQLVWALSTNQDIAIPGFMTIYVILAIVMITGERLEGMKLLRFAVVGFTLFFMGIWVAEGEGGYSTIFEKRTYVTYGAYQGIALSDEDYYMNESCYTLLTKYVSAEDKLFVSMGHGSSAYLNSDAKMAAGTSYARAGKGQTRVLAYWEAHPEQLPDYILIDTANKYYEEFEAGETYQYILENYPTTVAEEGSFILLSK
ncbi:hypothetical protein [Pseudobutyrivibrio sp. MD2005]|uniref:hypothetical protein n=1 Tax=Pseudobutyrivibrio sp. MD2005 TaxID=1410616 RepID=UPI0004802322|nr:hypothetical protein [Pseudobutyrivibrio sp. MD2005]